MLAGLRYLLFSYYIMKNVMFVSCLVLSSFTSCWNFSCHHLTPQEFCHGKRAHLRIFQRDSPWILNETDTLLNVAKRYSFSSLHADPWSTAATATTTNNTAATTTTTEQKQGQPPSTQPFLHYEYLDELPSIATITIPSPFPFSNPHLQKQKIPYVCERNKRIPNFCRNFSLKD